MERYHALNLVLSESKKTIILSSIENPQKFNIEEKFNSTNVGDYYTYSFVGLSDTLFVQK